PQVSILDALAQVGLMPDGRMFALNSYENRVYQAGVEDSAPVVVKFYRPGRWTDAQIVEEHAFTAELAAAEIPVVAPLEIDDRTLHAFERWHFAVFPRCAGRGPAIDQDHTLEWMGRFLCPIHVVGARRPFVA
ncbi:phosphotransferase, partial [Klebsiella pneumoniae]|uniref:phosphotransferase n=1 Tax=Klebsiella pneumoniae TaxID=573 RepID=UPI000F25E5CA